MLYIALILLILLVAVALVIAVQNVAALFSGIHLTFFSWHLPGIPVLVLCLLGIFLGGLLLYVVSSISARRDMRELKKLRVRMEELKKLRERVEELEMAQMRAPSGSLAPNFGPPPVVPIPGIPPTPPSGPLGPNGPLGPQGPRSAANSLQNLSPSASGNMPLPPRQFQGGGQRPPFPRQ